MTKGRKDLTFLRIHKRNPLFSFIYWETKRRAYLNIVHIYVPHVNNGTFGLVELVQRDLLSRVKLPDMIVDRVRPLADVATIRALITRQRVALVSIMSIHRVALRKGFLALRALILPGVRIKRVLHRLVQLRQHPGSVSLGRLVAP